MHQAGPPDRLLEGRPDTAVEPGQRGGEGGGGHPKVERPDPVEALTEVPQRAGAAGPHLRADRLDDGQRSLDVQLGAGQNRAQVGCVQPPSAQIDAGDHAAQV